MAFEFIKAKKTYKKLKVDFKSSLEYAACFRDDQGWTIAQSHKSRSEAKILKIKLKLKVFSLPIRFFFKQFSSHYGGGKAVTSERISQLGPESGSSVSTLLGTSGQQ